MSNDVNEYLFGGGAKAFQFNTIGDICRGTVVKAEMRQQTSIEGVPLNWDDGRPRMQLVVELQTDEHVDDDDDGIRTLYAKGGRFEIAEGEGQSMRDAIADAMKEQKEKSLDPGDELAVGFTGLGKAKRGYSAPKLYAASFRKGRKSVKASDLFGDEPTPIDTGV